MVWRALHRCEFTQEAYPDMTKREQESWLEYFKRCFLVYQRARKAVRDIVTVVLLKNCSHLKPAVYLRPFDERQLPDILSEVKMTLEYECLYKSLKDPYEDLLSDANLLSRAFHTG